MVGGLLCKSDKPSIIIIIIIIIAIVTRLENDIGNWFRSLCLQRRISGGLCDDDAH